MTTPPYPPPLDQLLALGPPEHRAAWADYRAMGFGPGHVPELIRMMLDPAFATADGDTPEVWGPLHAWRALGQLGDASAIQPLIELVEAAADDDDWVMDEVPEVFGMIGPAAIEPLRQALARHAIDFHEMTGATASNGLVEIAKRHPETRADVIGIIVRQLRWAGRQDPALNGFLVADLMDLKALETVPLIASILASGDVDLSITGDWEDVQLELGLISERTTPRPRYWTFDRHLRPSPGTPKAAPAGANPRGNAEKRRRKAEKAARRRNRKRG